MQGIENIEEVFQTVLAALSVVHCDKRDCGEGPVLYHERVGEVYAQRDKAGGEHDQTLLPVAEKAREYRQHDSEEAVVHVHINAQHERRHDRRTAKHKRDDFILLFCDIAMENTADKRRKRAFFALHRGFHAFGERHYDYRHGEHKEYSYVQVVRNDGVNYLAEKPEQEYPEKILEAVSCITKTLGNAVGVYREREPAYYTEYHLIREENKSRVVDEHGYGGDEL